MSDIWRIGEVSATKVPEIGGPLPLGGAGSMLPDAYPEAVREIPWLVPIFATEDGYLRLSVHSIVLSTPTATVVVDTGVGNGKERSNPFYNGLETDFAARLRTAVGGDLADVDAVICTHLHADHVGWNTTHGDDGWKPTFPNATYFLSATEHDRWVSAPHGFDAELFWGDSVQPILEAGMMRLVDDDAEVADGIRLEPTAGHTPGHVSVLVTSGGEQAVITGDVLHHPCQMAQPEWRSDFDCDPDAGTATRRGFLNRYADTGVLVIGTHFGGATGGYITRQGPDFRFIPA